MIHDTWRTITGVIGSDRVVEGVLCAWKFNLGVSFAREKREGNVKGCRSSEKKTFLTPNWSMLPLMLTAFPLTLAHTLSSGRENVTGGRIGQVGSAKKGVAREIPPLRLFLTES